MPEGCWIICKRRILLKINSPFEHVMNHKISSPFPLFLKSFLIISIAFAGNLQAQAIQEGKITKLFVSNDLSGKVDSNRVIIRLESDINGGLCPKKVYWQMLLTSPAEQAQYDLLLASYINNKKVKIWGNKTAECIHKGERIRNVEIAF